MTKHDLISKPDARITWCIIAAIGGAVAAVPGFRGAICRNNLLMNSIRLGAGVL